MKHTKAIVLWIGKLLLFILINCGLKFAAQVLCLPFWLDTIGTSLAAISLGTVAAVIAGISGNLLMGLVDPVSLYYIPVSILLAFLYSYCAKKGYLNRFSYAMITSLIAGIISLVISVILNLILFEGKTGNIWGDGLYDMLAWYGQKKITCSIAAEAAIDIIDKQLCMLITLLIIKIFSMKPKKALKTAISSIMICLIAIHMMLSVPAQVLYAQVTPKISGNDIVDIQDYNAIVPMIYNNQNGMPASEANVVEETSDGYIWIGGYAGLTHFDGTNFDFIQDKGISNVTAMLTDSKDRLWIGTNDNGVVCYANHEFTSYSAQHGLPVNSIRSFVEDADGRIYIGTTGTTCIFDGSSISTMENFPEFVTTMTIADHILYGITNAGELFCQEEDGTITYFENESNQVYFSTVASTPWGILAGTSGNGLYFIEHDEKHLSVSKILASPNIDTINSIHTDMNGLIWYCANNGFGYINQEEEFCPLNVQNFDGSIEWFHEDYQGNIWLASSRYGVLKLSDNRFYNLFVTYGIDPAVCNSIVLFDEKYYVGTDSGLVIIDTVLGTTVQNDLTCQLDGDRIRHLFVSSKNELWISTYGDYGLVNYCPELPSGEQIRSFTTDISEVSTNRFRCVTELSDGTIAAGTCEGLNLIQNHKLVQTITHEDGLENAQILCLYPNEDGSLYLGTDGAGIYLLKNGELTEHITTEEGLTSNVIMRMTKYEDGFFCVTSNSICYMKDQNARPVEYFPYYNNYDLIVHGENVYVTASCGIFVAKAEDLLYSSPFAYRLFNSNDGLTCGLIANSWNTFIDDEFYFCTTNGIFSWNSNSNQENVDYKLGISEICADGNELIPDNEFYYKLPQDSKRITIRASVRNYSLNNTKVLFYVEGMEKNVSPVQQNELETISLTNLSGGLYKLHLALVSDDESTVYGEQIYFLTKTMQIWEHDYFKFYLAFIVCWVVAFITWGIMMLYGIHRSRELLKQHERELEHQVERQTEKIRQQAKDRDEFQWSVIDGMATLIESRDNSTGGHVMRTKYYVDLLVSELFNRKLFPEQIDERFVSCIGRVAPLHDVGKIKISDTVLNKTGKFTDEDYAIMKQHSAFGGDIVKTILGDKADSYMVLIAKEVANYHHERPDGKGYPFGLTDVNIPLSAKIMAVADVFDALCAKRVYKDAMELDEVFSIMEQGRGTQFDATILDVFLSIDKEKLTVFSK